MKTIIKNDNDCQYWKRKIKYLTKRIEALVRRLSWAKSQTRRYWKGEAKLQRSCVQSKNIDRINTIESKILLLRLARLNAKIRFDLHENILK